MKIIKAKVTKDKTLIAVYKNENDDTVTIEGKNIVHKDLEFCFTELVPHLAFLCEMKEADGKESFDELPDDILNTLDVTGFSIGGDGDSEGVTLTGKRFLKSKKVLNLNAPFTMNLPKILILDRTSKTILYETNNPLGKNIYSHH